MLHFDARPNSHDPVQDRPVDLFHWWHVFSACGIYSYRGAAGQVVFRSTGAFTFRDAVRLDGQLEYGE